MLGNFDCVVVVICSGSIGGGHEGGIIHIRIADSLYFIRTWCLHGEITEIVQSLAVGTLQGAPDSSVQKGKGTSTWQIEPKSHQKLSEHYIHGVGLVNGDENTMNLTRMEQGGFDVPLYYI